MQHAEVPPFTKHAMARPQVVGASVALAVLSFPFARWMYIKHWQRMTQRELFEQKMLRRARGCPLSHNTFCVPDGASYPAPLAN